MTDPHRHLSVDGVPEHLATHHAHQADIAQLIASVTDDQVADYRSRVLETADDGDDIVKPEIVHELLHDQHGDDH